MDAEVAACGAAHGLQESLHGVVDLAAQPVEDGERQGDDEEQGDDGDDGDLRFFRLTAFLLRSGVLDAVLSVLVDAGDSGVERLDNLGREDGGFGLLTVVRLLHGVARLTQALVALPKLLLCIEFGERLLRDVGRAEIRVLLCLVQGIERIFYLLTRILNLLGEIVLLRRVDRYYLIEDVEARLLHGLRDPVRSGDEGRALVDPRVEIVEFADRMVGEDAESDEGNEQDAEREQDLVCHGHVFHEKPSPLNHVEN